MDCFSADETVILNGLQDAGASAEDYLYVSADMNFNLAGYTFQQDLMTLSPVPLCEGNFEADEMNGDDCPADGYYNFNAQYDLPAPDNEIIGWAASGWDGEVIMKIYHSMYDSNETHSLVGECTMEFETMVSGAYENGILRTAPSAKMSAMGIAALMITLFACWFYCCCAACCCSKKDPYLMDEVEYNRMNKSGSFML